MRTVIDCWRCHGSLMSGEEHEPVRCLSYLRPQLDRVEARASLLAGLIEALEGELVEPVGASDREAR